jgi:hypothetical protein
MIDWSMKKSNLFKGTRFGVKWLIGHDDDKGRFVADVQNPSRFIADLRWMGRSQAVESARFSGHTSWTYELCTSMSPAHLTAAISITCLSRHITRFSFKYKMILAHRRRGFAIDEVLNHT